MRDGAAVAVLTALVDAFNAHDLDRIMAFFAADAILGLHHQHRRPDRGARL